MELRKDTQDSSNFSQSSEPATFPSEDDFKVVERRITRKCDLRVVPIMSWLLFLNFMDRFNIGNAFIFNMPEDLHMSASGYNAALFIFLVSYITFPVPQNLMLKRFGPSNWVPFNVFFMGTVFRFVHQLPC